MKNKIIAAILFNGSSYCADVIRVAATLTEAEVEAAIRAKKPGLHIYMWGRPTFIFRWVGEKYRQEFFLKQPRKRKLAELERMLDVVAPYGDRRHGHVLNGTEEELLERSDNLRRAS